MQSRHDGDNRSRCEVHRRNEPLQPKVSLIPSDKVGYMDDQAFEAWETRLSNSCNDIFVILLFFRN